MKTLIHPIYFENDSFQKLIEFLKNYKDYYLFVLVDENTKKLCYPLLCNMLKSNQPEIIEIQSGEFNKNIQTCEKIWNNFLKIRAHRKSLLLNLGGGVICDLGGFVASIYKRGIPFVHIPTTLLSAIDASIGGKTGIDFQIYKNLLGVFSYPSAVFIFPGFLKTLDLRQLKSGFAEILKHALIADKEYWKSLQLLKDFENTDWNPFIKKSVQIKSNIVKQDSKENYLRKILNFGHTYGHAFESFSLIHHKTPLLHGEAIAMGIMAETYLSNRYLSLKEYEVKEIECLIKNIFSFPKFSEKDIDELIDFMLQDKKNKDEHINFTLIESIGKGKIDQLLRIEQVKENLKEFFQKNN